MVTHSTPRLVMLQHELLMALGTSSEPNEILEAFTTCAIKALDLQCIYIVQKDRPAAGLEERMHRVPFMAPKMETYPPLLKYLVDETPTTSGFLEERQQDQRYWYCFTIKNLGFIILERSVKPFDQSLITALNAPVTRFGQVYVDRMQFLLNDQHRAQIKSISEHLEE